MSTGDDADAITALPAALVRAGLHPEAARAWRAECEALRARVVAVEAALNAMGVWISLEVADAHGRLAWAQAVERRVQPWFAFQYAPVMATAPAVATAPAFLLLHEDTPAPMLAAGAPLLLPLIAALAERMQTVAPAREALADAQPLAAPLDRFEAMLEGAVARAEPAAADDDDGRELPF